MVLSAAFDGILLHVDLTSEGFGRFYSTFKLQLALMALAIPLGATLARAHSSDQTATLIRQSQRRELIEAEQNQRNDFLDYLEVYEGKVMPGQAKIPFNKKVISQPLVAYSFFFNAGGSDSNNVLLDQVSEIYRLLDEFSSSLNIMLNSDSAVEYVEKRSHSLCWLSISLQEIARKLGVDYRGVPITSTPEGDILPRTRFGNMSTGGVVVDSQKVGYGITRSNASSLASAFYYAGQVLSLRNRKYGQLLLGSALTLQALVYIMNARDAVVGLDDLRRLGLITEEMDAEVVGMIRAWCQFMPDFETFRGRELHLRSAMEELRKAIASIESGSDQTCL